MKYRGVELPYQLGQKLKRFSKRGVGKLFVVLEPLHRKDDAFSRIDKLFNDPTPLSALVKEFGETAKLKDVLDQLFNGRKRLATEAEQKEYDKLIQQAIKYVDDYKVRKDRQKKHAEQRELQKAQLVIARHEKKAEKNAAAK